MLAAEIVDGDGLAAKWSLGASDGDAGERERARRGFTLGRARTHGSYKFLELFYCELQADRPPGHVAGEQMPMRDGPAHASKILASWRSRLFGSCHILREDDEA
jgi:hypothetical protein